MNFKEKGDTIPSQIIKTDTTPGIENTEARKKIIEEAQNERLELSKNVTARIIGYINEHIPKSVQNIASSILNATPIGQIKMATESIVGKTATGEKLSTKDRIMYGLIVSTTLAAYMLIAYGASKGDSKTIETGAITYATSWGLFTAQMGPEVIKNAQNTAEKYQFEQLAKFLSIIEGVLEKMDYKNIKEYIKNKINKEENDSQ